MHIRDEDVHVFHSYDYCPCLKTSCLCTARKIQATPINNFGLAVWVTVGALLSWSLESPVVLLCMQMSHCSPCAAKGFHSHSNHPSSILPHLLYSSACPALPSATRAEAQWSAVQRYITSWEARGGGRKRSQNVQGWMQIWSTHHQNGGWEQRKKCIKRSSRCILFCFYHTAVGPHPFLK